MAGILNQSEWRRITQGNSRNTQMGTTDGPQACGSATSRQDSVSTQFLLQPLWNSPANLGAGKDEEGAHKEKRKIKMVPSCITIDNFQLKGQERLFSWPKWLRTVYNLKRYRCVKGLALSSSGRETTLSPPEENLNGQWRKRKAVFSLQFMQKLHSFSHG